MKPLHVRALELHGQRMWERESVLRVLSFMQRNDMNTLVLHESDLVHQIVYPRTCFDPYALWSDLPSRRGENAIFNRRAYIDHLLKLARDAGVAVWVNIKEIGFSDEVLAIHPELIKNGVVCPSEPFWQTYVEHKTGELFADFPLLAGMIVSFGSQESRASRVQNLCKCDLCAGEPLGAWYARFIEALREPASRHGKQLAIRDFAYKPQDHAPLIDAVDQAPQDVLFCIKAMPHDFYLSFPDNPAIAPRPRGQWVEYDVMGQFFGWGLMPCFVLDDLRRRMAHWARNGVEGGLFRIEWERINDLDALDTLNETNLIAAAALARGEEVDAIEVCRRWLASKDRDPRDAGWLADVLGRTPQVVKQAAYMGDFVSADNSMLPRSIERAWWGMEQRDSLAAWDPARSDDLTLDRAKLAAFLREKEQALAAAQALVAHIEAPVDLADPALQHFVRSHFAHFVVWVEGLALCAKVCLLSRWLTQSPASAGPADLQALSQTLALLEDYAARTEAMSNDTRIPHQVIMLIDPRRALDVVREGWAVHRRAAQA